VRDTAFPGRFDTAHLLEVRKNDRTTHGIREIPKRGDEAFVKLDETIVRSARVDRLGPRRPDFCALGEERPPPPLGRLPSHDDAQPAAHLVLLLGRIFDGRGPRVGQKIVGVAADHRAGDALCPRGFVQD
jgi:hypothetical protein